MTPVGSTKPIYLRGIPGHVVREAKAIAARRGITLASFVTDAIVRAIRQHQQPSQSDAQTSSESGELTEDLSNDMRWFEEQRERLARELSGEYAAIVEQTVIDHDADFDALARRVFARCGLRNVFMPLVTAGAPPRPVRIRSPRVDGARAQAPRATRAR